MKIKRADLYQMALIALGVLAVALFFVFWKRELFPEYRIYQNDYDALEKFRSSYSREPPPEFKKEVKQIVIEREDRGNPTIDRCISCHVALQLPHFSPTKLAHDPNGNLVRDEKGLPVKIPNEEYVWAKLDEKIKELIGSNNIQEANDLKSLKSAQVGEHVYDVTKALQMHPLIGKETRPFEFHPIEEYGCVSCHSGNGRALTTDKAHGPVFDGQYDIEDEGPKPEFLEKDPKNDPKFSTMFNYKPGSSLLFQTTPVLSGALIESKCVQCHLPSAIAAQSHIDAHTKNYQKGEELYITQACYACHRIAGFARGGLGPELTLEGKSYPWFIKESIVWPQADLRTSTMPNYRLDHDELVQLMTYLLGQTGSCKAVSPIAHKVAIQEWEKGKKLPWEKPITPVQTHDLRYAMTVFATEGCVACHRLKGFESDVGFNENSSFDALQKEHTWFAQLFPEFATGSQIVQKLEQHAEEIDNKIISNVRSNSILEEIEKKHPGHIAGLYSNFKYAERAKNHFFSTQIAQHPQRREEFLAEWKLWKDRVHRVLMMFIQEYGLGRLVGPRPNWSGIFRTDEWLMEHFRNPSAHVPRSIMPVFPFDDTKFYALTLMLDQLGIRNRDETRAIWNHEGFSPEKAFEIHCLQCHGEYRSGNGPVSEWIYPIPKNLRNADFLRNLTKERVIQSIKHGVKGTPMPPWGEVAKDKTIQIGSSPVLKPVEIEMLTDWLFSNLPGGEVIRTSEEVPKWQYAPQDILDELDHQQELFSVTVNAAPNPETHSYYIQQKFYTKENIEAGKAFFELNCAICHGKEGDGSGERAGLMQESKPRMLTNLDWIDTRDDLRLLRSIKYGVPGTAMIPWGDQTSPLQRIQLLLFIRSLSKDNEMRRQLSSAIYKAIDVPQFVVETARLDEYKKVDDTKKMAQQLRAEREEVLRNKSEESSKKASELYYQELQLLDTLREQEKRDQLFVQLKELIAEEETVLLNLGQSLLGNKVESDVWDNFIAIVTNNKNGLKDKILSNLNSKIQSIEHSRNILEGKFSSQSRNDELAGLIYISKSLNKLHNQVTSSLEQVEKLKEKQAILFEKIQQKPNHE